MYLTFGPCPFMELIKIYLLQNLLKVFWIDGGETLSARWDPGKLFFSKVCKKVWFLISHLASQNQKM